MSRSSSAPTGSIRRKGTKISLAAAVAAVLAAQSASGTILMWNDADSKNSWDLVTGTNWLGGAAWNNTTPDSAIFGGPGEAITLDAPITAAGLTFNSSGYTLSGGTLTLSGATPTLTTTSGVTATINSVIAGSGWTNASAGTMILGGASSNTYSGAVTATGSSAGQLILSKTGGATAITGDLALANTGTGGSRFILSATQDNQFGTATPGVLRFTGAGDIRFELKGTTQTLGGIDNSTVASPNFHAIQHSEFGSPSAVSSASQLILNVGTGGAYTFNGAVRDQGGVLSLVKTGEGTQTLAGASISYTGATTISGGRLILKDTGASFDSASTSIAGGGVLEFNVTGSNTSSLNNNGQTFSGVGVIEKTGTGLLAIGAQNQNIFINLGSGALFNIKEGTARNEWLAGKWAGNRADMNIEPGARFDVWDADTTVDALTGGGNVNKGINAGGGFTIGVDNGSGLFSGTLTNTSVNSQGTLNVTKTGAGTQTLTGASTYTGTTTVSNGVLRLDFSGAQTSNVISGSSAFVLNGGTLEIKGGSGEANTQTVNGLTGVGGTLQLTPNGAASIDVTLGAVSLSGMYNFAGSDATVDALGSLSFRTTTTTTGDNGTTRLGASLWNGTDWASTSTGGGINHVVKWVGTYNDLATDANNLTNPTGDLRIKDGAAPGKTVAYTNDTAINSLLMSAPTYSSTVDVAAGKTLTIGSTAGTGAVAIVPAGQLLTLGSAVNQGNLTAGTAANATLALNNQNPSASLTVNSAIVNNTGGAISLAAAGKIVLNGTNTYTGATTIFGGSNLQVSGAGSLGAAGSYGGAIANNGVFQYSSSAVQTLSGIISGTGSLVKDTNNSTLTLTGVNTYTGSTTIGAGTIQIGGSGSLASGNYYGNIANNGTLQYSSSAAQTLSGNITGSGSLLKDTATSTLTLSGANSYSGTTTINAGTLIATSAAALSGYNSPGKVVVGSAGTVAVKVGGPGQWGSTEINSLVNNANFASATSTLAFDTTDGSFTHSGAITGPEALAKVSRGTLTFNGANANTFTGLTTVYQGELVLAKTGGVAALGGDLTFDNNLSPDVYTMVDNQFASGAVVSFINNTGDHGRLELMGTTQIVAGVQTVGYTGQRGVIQNREFGPINTGTSTLVLNGSGNYTFTGYMRDGSGSNFGKLALTKSGTGTQTLNGPQINYTGATTVNSGTLRLLNTTGFASATTVAGGNLTIAANGTSITGMPAAATISLAGGNLTLNNETNNYIVMNGAVTANNAAGSTIFYQSAGGVSSSGAYLDGGLKGTNATVNIDVTGAQAGSGVVLRNANTTITGSIIVNGNGTGAANEAGIAILAGTPVLSGADITLNSARLETQQIAGDISWATVGGSATIGALNGNANAIAHGVNTLTVGSTGHDGVFAGVISGTQAFVKTGTGTQILSGANTYTGSTAVNGGVLCLDFSGTPTNTTNIVSSSSALVLNNGTLEIKGGPGETNAQTFNGASGFGGKLLLTPNGAASLSVSLGNITGGGVFNFAGADTGVSSGVATLGPTQSNFITTATAGSNNGQTLFGANLWNGADWASIAKDAGTTKYVVKWQGNYTDLTTDGLDNTNPTGDLRVQNGGDNGTTVSFSANTTINSLLMGAASYSTTVDTQRNTLTVGSGANATGAVAIANGAKSLTIGTSANPGVLTAGTAAGSSTLVLNNTNPDATLTVNSAITNGANTTLVLSTAGNVVLNGANTYSGGTNILNGTLQVAGGATLGASNNYAGAISNTGTLRYSSTADQTLAGIISGVGGLIKDTANSTLTLSGATNSYTGATTISAGTIKLGHANGLGSSSLVTVASGGTLDVAGFSTTRPVEISGTGAGSTAALYNSSTTAGGAVGSLKLNADATIANAVAGSDAGKLLSTGFLDLNGKKLTITGGAINVGLQSITSGDIVINSGGTLYALTSSSLASATGTITINTGGFLDTRDSNNTGATTVHTIALNGGTLGNGMSVGNNGGGIGARLKNDVTVDATNGGTISSVGNGNFGNPVRLFGSISGIGALTVNGYGVEFLGDGSGYTGTISGGTGNVSFNTAGSQIFSGSFSGSRTITKTGTGTTILGGNNGNSGATNVSAGTLILTGANTASGTTTVAAGSTLRLDYNANDNRKISSGALTLSGGTIELVNGTFADSVASTTLTAATGSTITRPSGTAVLDLKAITANTSSYLNFAQSGIAKTTNANNANGILGSWALVGGSQFAMNDGSGLIVAAATTDLTRLNSGSKVIPDGANNNIRFVEGTGSAGNFTLGSAATTINTLTQSSVGGASAATIDMGGQTLALNTVVVGTGAGALTIGTATDNGMLKAAGTAIEFHDLAAAGITVNSVVADGTGATTVTKSDAGTLTFSGTNTYSGGTTVNAGTLTASLGTTAGARSAFGTGPITANSGTTLRFFAGSTGNAMSHANAINLNSATLISDDANQTFTGNINLSGANTIQVKWSDKSATMSGTLSGTGSFNKTDAGTLTLSGNNSYNGGTTLTAGTLKAASVGALGASGQNLTLNGGTLQLATDSALTSKNLTIGGNSTISLDRATIGAGFTTTFGNLTFGDTFTLTVNKGANVIGGISTLNFTGFPAFGASGKTAGFNIGADAEVNISGSLTGTQSFANVTKSGVGTLILSGNNNYWDPASSTGLITVSGGTLDLRHQNAMGDGGTGVNSIALSMAASTTLRLGTDTSLGNNADLTLTGSGVTIVSDRATAGAGITNTFDVLSIGAHTLNVTGGSNVTSGATQVNFNSATLTGNATLNVINPAAGTTNVQISGVVGGAFNLTKTGSGTLTLQGNNTYSGTTTISGGTLTLNGANGSIKTSTGITIGNGATLTLANTNSANNTDRIAGTLTMNGGTLNFTNNQNAVNYSETTGALTIGAGFNTISTGQAAANQTSILTFASLARTGGTLNFSGTGLGTTVDTKNEIRFTTNPALPNGIIGTWATVNGKDFATTTGANNSVVAYNGYTDVTRLGSVASSIADGSTSNVRIVEGGGSVFNILLGAPTTTINTLNQSNSGGSSAATIDPVGKTLAVNSILVGSGAGGLTIGTGTNNGTLKSTATSLQIIENTSGGSTINSDIADGTGASSFTKSGTGTLTLSGNNSYTGATTIEGGVLAVSTLANGGGNSGIGAAAVAQGNLVLNGGTLRYTGAGPTASTDRGFTITDGSTGTIDVSNAGTTLTISGGIANTTGNFVKSGAGILTLTGTNSFTGTTTINGGNLVFGTGSGTLTYVGGQIDINSGATMQVSKIGSSNRYDFGTQTFNFGTSGGGKITIGSGVNWVAQGNWTFKTNGGAKNTIDGAAAINLNAGGRSAVLDVARGSDPTSDLDIAIGIQNTAGALTKLGAGIATLTGANTYTGNTIISAGTLNVSGTGSLNSGTYAGNIANAGTLNWNSTAAQAFSGQLTGSGTYNFNAGSVTLSGGGAIGGALKIVPSTSGTTMGITGGTYNIASFSLFQNSINNSMATYNQSGGAVNVSGIFKLGDSTAGGSSNDTNVANFTGGIFTAGTIDLYKWANSQVNISGTANVTAGTLHIGWDGNPQGTITVSNGGTFAWATSTFGGSAIGDSPSAYQLHLNGGTLKYSGTSDNSSWIPSRTGGYFSKMDVQDSGATINNGGFNVTVAQDISHGGASATDGGLVLTGAGMTTLTGNNSYTGKTTVSAGTLAVSGSISGSMQIEVQNSGSLLLGGGGTSTDRIGDTVPVTLGSGAGSSAKLQLDNSAGQISETVGTLTLANNSVLDLGTGGAGSVFHFADSSAQTWTGTLSIYNWTSSSDHLFFANSSAGLTSGQLSSIIFYSDAGTTSLASAGFLADGEIAPVPESTTLVSGLAMLGYVFFHRRRTGRWSAVDRRSNS